MDSLPIPKEPPQENLPALIASLPLWQRRFLAAIQHGNSIDEARKAVGVSPSTITKFTADASPFARALELVTAGVALLGADYTRERSTAHSGALVEHFAQAATNPKEKLRDQVAAGRVVLESAGVIGPRPPESNAQEQARSIVVELGKLMLESQRARGLRAPRETVVPAQNVEQIPPDTTGAVEKDAKTRDGNQS